MRSTLAYVRVTAMTMIALAIIDPIPLCALAETKTIEAEATYIMGDGESPAFAESIALQKAKQTALEQAGTYVESYTKIQNLDLTTEEIQTIAGGVLRVELLQRTRALVGDALRFYVKIRATVTTDKMEELARRIKGKNVAQQYDHLRRDYARLSVELESLRSLLAATPQGLQREAALLRLLEQEKSITELEKTERTFFERLLVGELLVQEAHDKWAMLNRLLREIRDEGHVIEIEKPRSNVRRQGDLIVEIPITVSISKSLLVSIRSIAGSLGGSLYPVPEWGGILSGPARSPNEMLNTGPTLLRYFVPDTLYFSIRFQTQKEPYTGRYSDVRVGMEPPPGTEKTGNIYEHPLVGTMIRLSSSEEVNFQFREWITTLVLMIHLSFSDGNERTCKAPFLMNRILPVDEYYTDRASFGVKRDSFVTSPYHDLPPNVLTKPIDWHDLRDFVQYVGILSDPISFRVKFALSEQDVNKLKGVEAKFAEVKSREDLAKDVCLTVIENK